MVQVAHFLDRGTVDCMAELGMPTFKEYTEVITNIMDVVDYNQVTGS